MIRNRKVGTNNGNLAILDNGVYSSDAIVFLHGLGLTKDVFTDMFHMFSNLKDVRLISLDIRGHGDSVLMGPYKINQVVCDIKELLTLEKVNRVILIASSFSCLIAEKFASQFPNFVYRLILLDGGYYKFSDVPGYKAADSANQISDHYKESFESKEELENHINSYIKKVKRITGTAGRIDILYRHSLFSCYKRHSSTGYIHKTPRNAYLSYFQDFVSCDLYSEILPFITAPTLLIQADYSKYNFVLKNFIEKSLKLFSSLIPHSQITKIPNSDHLIMLSNPNECEYLIKKFLEQ